MEGAEADLRGASLGGRKEVPSKSQAEVGAHPLAPSAPLSAPHAPFSEPPGWHMVSPTEPDPVDHLRSPEPTLSRLLLGWEPARWRSSPAAP